MALLRPGVHVCKKGPGSSHRKIAPSITRWRSSGPWKKIGQNEERLSQRKTLASSTVNIAIVIKLLAQEKIILDKGVRRLARFLTPGVNCSQPEHVVVGGKRPR
jgi:hypothetical protein